MASWWPPDGLPNASWLPHVCAGKAKALDEAEGLYAGARTFNAANRWRKRGVWTMCVKYNLGNASYGQQATVNVNADGSISLAHTGLEMGQGMNTKAVQSVAYELGSGLIADPAVLLALVRTVSPTTTDGHNADDQTNTWGSGTSESVAFACLEACKTLKARLLPYKSPSATTWQQIVGAAASAGVVLSETHTKRKQVDGGNYLQYAEESSREPRASQLDVSSKASAGAFLPRLSLRL